MIARVHFKATVVERGKTLSMKDYVDIQVPSLAVAKVTFKTWLRKGLTVRGHNGVFHLSDGQSGSMELIKVERRPKDHESD